MNRIKIVQIGVGHDHARTVLDSLWCQPELFEVVGFAVPDEERETFAEKIRKEFLPVTGGKMMTVREALDYPGLDAVAVETEEKNLTRFAMMAAEKGYAIHMDKPGGLDADGFSKLIELVKKKKIPFSIGYMYRFNPCVQSVIEKVRSGELGEIFSVEAQMNCEHPREKREWLGQFPGGMMFYLGCHLVDLVYRIQGKPEEIIPFNASTGDVFADDFGFAVWKYKNGVSFIKTCARESGGFLRRQLVVCGTKGTVEINPIETIAHGQGRKDFSSVYRETKSGGNWLFDIGELHTTESYNRYDAMMKNFAELVRGKENPYSYEYESELYRLLLRSCGLSDAKRPEP